MSNRLLMRLVLLATAFASAACTDPKKFVEGKLAEVWKPMPLPPPPMGPPLRLTKSEATVSEAKDGSFTGEGIAYYVLGDPLFRAIEEPAFDASPQWQQFEALRAEMAASNLPMAPATESLRSAADLVMGVRAENPGIGLRAAVEVMPVDAPVEFRVGLSGVYDTKAGTVQVTSAFSPQLTPDLDAMRLLTRQGLGRLQAVPDEGMAVKQYLADLSEAVDTKLKLTQEAAAATKKKYEAARDAFAPGTKFGGSYDLEDRAIPVIFEVVSYDIKDDTFQVTVYDKDNPEFRKQYVGVWKRPRRDEEIDGRNLELQAAGRDGPLRRGLRTPALFEATSNVWEFQLEGSRLAGQLRNSMKGSQISLERL
jgi:hypothetical protein